MSAEYLRETARMMREVAEAASNWEPSRWFAVDGAVYGGMASPHQVVTPLTTYDGDAEHIAAWHPAVAVSVARLLVMVASDWDQANAISTQIDDAMIVARTWRGDA